MKKRNLIFLLLSLASLIIMVIILFPVLKQTGHVISCSNDAINPDLIIPLPQNSEFLSCDEVVVDSSWKIIADLNTEDEFAANYLKENIGEVVSFNLGIQNVNSNLPAKKIVIGNPNENSAIAQLATEAGINIDLEIIKGFNQGYVLLIEEDQILVLANSSQGAFYGVVSLVWLLKEQNKEIILPNVKIVDWPDLEHRGFYGFSNVYRNPYYSSEQEWVDNLVKYKYNFWVITLKYLDDESTQQEIGALLDLKNYMKERHFLFGLNLDPRELPKQYEPNLYEGVYIFDKLMKFNDSNYAVSLGVRAVEIKNSGFEKYDSNNIIDDWHFLENKQGDSWSLDCSESHLGDCSAKLKLNNSLLGTTSSAYLVSGENEANKFYNVNSMTDYYFSFWAKGKGTISAKKAPQVSFVFLDSSGAIVNIKSIFIPHRDDVWREYYLTVPANPDSEKFYIYSRIQSGDPVELWLDDFEVSISEGELYNIIETPNTRLHVFNMGGTIEYDEGVDYELETSGDFNIHNPVKGKKTKIKRIVSGSIPANSEIAVDFDTGILLTGDLPYPSFSDPSFFEVFNQNLIYPNIKHLKPDYIFFTMDEIRGMNRDSRAMKQDKDNYLVLADFINNLTDLIHSQDPNIKIIIWDDMLNPFHNGGDEDYQVQYRGPEGKSWYSLDLLNKNIILISWWYNENDYLFKMANSPNIFEKYGFNFIAGPRDNNRNIQQWSYLSQKYNAWGMIKHEFDGIISGVADVADYSWNAVGDYSEMCNSDYLEVCDGIDNDCDDIYWTSKYDSLTGVSNIDEGFDLDSDAFNCGSCGNICYYPKAYGSCVDGVCHFDGCYEGYSNLDGDVKTGCGGPCLPACKSGEICSDSICVVSYVESSCGDGTCDPSETYYNCDEDCDEPVDSYCGDGTCNSDESSATCEKDCPPEPNYAWLIIIIIILILSAIGFVTFVLFKKYNELK